jgi:D-threo-aldose 1-dehydrogenase
MDDCAASAVAVVNGAPFGSGLLGKGPGVTQRYAYSQAPSEIIEAARRIKATCQRYGVPLAAAALQFSLLEPGIAATIVGITKPELVAQMIELAEYSIPESLWQELSPAPEDVWLS